MKAIFLALLLAVFAVIFLLAVPNRETVTHKMESSFVKYNIKDLPEHGISLISPSDATVSKSPKTVDPYSVVIRNRSSRAVVGYSIKWECFDGKNESANRDISYDHWFSNILGVVFLHGEETERRNVLSTLEEVIEPNSSWHISPNFPARKIDGDSKAVSTGIDEAVLAKIRAACPVMTVTVDGVFFDDGTFIGSDTTNFFARVKTQMDVRYEVLQGVRDELQSGKNPVEVFNGLERIRDSEETPVSGDETRSYFRNLSVRDVLGMKNTFGTETAIKTVQLQLSKPWVKLRKL